MSEATTEKLKELFRNAAGQIRNGFGGASDYVGPIYVAISATTDGDSVPEDAECYSTEDTAAFYSGGWSYLVLRVGILVDGVEMGNAQLGAVEHGLADKDEVEIEYLIETMSDLFYEASNEGLPRAKALVEGGVVARRLASQL